MKRCAFLIILVLFANTGLSTASADTLVSTAIEVFQEQDIIGIYFESSGTQYIYHTNEPNELVIAYLMIINPSTNSGVLGWECCVEIVGNTSAEVWALTGSAINFAEPPCFSVGITGSPLAGEECIMLATVYFIQVNPNEATYFYIHPLEYPSIPGVPAYASSANPNDLIPLGWSSGSEELPVALVNDPIAEMPPVARKTMLHPNAPNPCNPVTSISFDIAQPCFVRLDIVNLSGRKIKTIVDEYLHAATYRRIWNGRDDHDRSVASGIYLYRLKAGEYVKTRQMTLVR